MTAQMPTISTSTSARSRCPNTGPAVRLLNARMASRPAAMNAYTANTITRARTVTWGQASEMIPTATASRPRRISDVLSELNDLNMTVVLSCARSPGHATRGRQPTPAGAATSHVA